MTKQNLVVFYSWSGNTKSMAMIISQLIDCDVYEIKVPAATFSDDMYATSDTAKRQIATGQLPELMDPLPDFSQSTSIFIGGPTWSGAPSTPVLQVLQTIATTHATLIPFYTHAGTAGQYEQTFAQTVPGMTVLKGLGLSGVTGSQAEQRVRTWLSELGYLL